MEAKGLAKVEGTGAPLLALFGGQHSGLNSDGTKKVVVPSAKKKKNRGKIPRAVRELREPDGLDPRDLIGL